MKMEKLKVKIGIFLIKFRIVVFGRWDGDLLFTFDSSWLERHALEGDSPVLIGRKVD